MLNDWHALGSVQYRKWHVYDMAWGATSEPNGRPFALEHHIVCGAPFGGPIASYPDPKRPGNDPSKPTVLTIYSSSGVKLSETVWKDRPIIGMGWTDLERLIVVADNGMVKMYDLYCRLTHEMHLLLDSHASTNILECHFWGNGIACMTNDLVIRVAEVNWMYFAPVILWTFKLEV